MGAPEYRGPVIWNVLNRVVYFKQSINRAFSHDVTAAILVFHNNEMAAMLADGHVGENALKRVFT